MSTTTPTSSTPGRRVRVLQPCILVYSIFFSAALVTGIVAIVIAFKDSEHAVSNLSKLCLIVAQALALTLFIRQSYVEFSGRSTKRQPRPVILLLTSIVLTEATSLLTLESDNIDVRFLACCTSSIACFIVSTVVYAAFQARLQETKPASPRFTLRVEQGVVVLEGGHSPACQFTSTFEGARYTLAPPAYEQVIMAEGTSAATAAAAAGVVSFPDANGNYGMYVNPLADVPTDASNEDPFFTNSATTVHRLLIAATGDEPPAYSEATNISCAPAYSESANVSGGCQAENPPRYSQIPTDSGCDSPSTSRSSPFQYPITVIVSSSPPPQYSELASQRDGDTQG